VAGAAMTLPPHVFVEIRRYHVLGRAEHFLKPALHGVPIRFHVVGADASLWVAEVFAMIHRLVNIAEAGELAVRSPLIGPYGSSCNNNTTHIVIIVGLGGGVSAAVK